MNRGLGQVSGGGPYHARKTLIQTGFWFSFNALGCILGAILAFGLYKGDTQGKLSIDGWRLVYIILGVLTVFIGILFFIFIPDTPDKARFLSPADRKLAVERIRSNQQGVINKSFRMEQVKEAFTDKFVSATRRPELTVDLDLLYGLPFGMYPQRRDHQVSPLWYGFGCRI